MPIPHAVRWLKFFQQGQYLRPWSSWSVLPSNWPLNTLGLRLPWTHQRKAHLLIEVDGFDSAELMPQLERIYPAVNACGAGEPLLAEDEAAKNQLWRLSSCRG